MSGMTNYLGNLIITDYITKTGVWLGLHTTDPGATGTTSTELVGGGYARQKVVWSAASNRSTGNTNSMTFLNLPAGTLGYLAIWDAQTAGNLLYSIPFPNGTTITVVAGQYLALPASDVAVVLN